MDIDEDNFFKESSLLALPRQNSVVPDNSILRGGGGEDNRNQNQNSGGAAGSDSGSSLVQVNVHSGG